MKVFIGTDHRGVNAKDSLVSYLKKQGVDVNDSTPGELNPEDDFPVAALGVVKSVLAEPDSYGILLCGSGQGMVMAANRHKGIRAMLGYDEAGIKAARNDDDANILCMPAELETEKMAELSKLFIETSFAGAPRFIRRIKELDEL